MLGRQANANPEMVRQVRAAGHTIGTHTQNHPMHRMSLARAITEINTGIDSVGNALGSPHALAPFFRFPGLYRTSAAEQY
jgi:peptidoglycan/xylan/chitin deacetylase (PgdA/CDA1 family)